MQRDSAPAWHSLAIRLLLIVCLISACLYSVFAIRAYRAFRLSTKQDQPALKRAIRLEPNNAEYYDLLGRNILFTSQEPSLAVDAFKKANKLNPYNSFYLLDLAQAYYTIGDKEKNLSALRSAIAIDPRTPNLAWSAGNFFVVQGDIPEALQQFAIVLNNDPGLAAPVLSICWRMLQDTEAIEKILPPDPAVHLEFIKLLLNQGELAAAHNTWSKLIQLRREFDYHQALFYIDSLIEAYQAAPAREAWNQLASTSTALARYLAPDNLVVNNTFAEDVLNAGFDWRYHPNSIQSLALDPTDVHGGGRSLLISYSGAGGDPGIYQYVPVDPDTQYTLSAWVKSDDLQTANGPSVTVLDAFGNTIYAATDETVGTTPWHKISKDFETNGTTKMLVIRFLRNPNNTAIRGRFWIGDISLRRLLSQKASDLGEHVR